MNFSLLAVNCLGCCGLAPVITVDNDVYGKITLSRIPKILKEYKEDTRKMRKEKIASD